MKINRPTTTFRRRSGFTLLEIVIVLGIIAVLMGGSIALVGKIKDGAKLQRVGGDFNAIGSALMTYKINAGSYPTTAQGLKALVTKPAGARKWVQLSKAEPLDPWGNDYGYVFPGKKDKSEYELISKGPDGQLNTEDDLSSQDE